MGYVRRRQCSVQPAIARLDDQLRGGIRLDEGSEHRRQPVFELFARRGDTHFPRQSLEHFSLRQAFLAVERQLVGIGGPFLFDEADQAVDIRTDKEVAVRRYVVHEHPCKHARARHPVGTVVDDRADKDFRIAGKVVLGKSHPVPVAERAEPFVGAHAHDEFERPALDFGMRVDLEHAEIRDDPVGHFLDAIILAQPQFIAHRRH